MTYHLHFWRRDLRTGTIERISFDEDRAPGRWTENGVTDHAAHHLVDYWNAHQGRAADARFIFWLEA